MCMHGAPFFIICEIEYNRNLQYYSDMEYIPYIQQIKVAIFEHDFLSFP